MSLHLSGCRIVHHNSALPVFVSPWYSILALFSSVSSSFSPVRLLRLEFRNPYSHVSSKVLRHPSISYGCSFSPLSFVFLPCLHFFWSSRFHSPAFFLPLHRSVLPVCVSLHPALRFLLSFRLVRSRFRASTVFLAVRLPGPSFFTLVFFPFPAFVFGSFPSATQNFACWCVRFVFGCFYLAFR